jgi:hypothetical protein
LRTQFFDVAKRENDAITRVQISYRGVEISCTSSRELRDHTSYIPVTGPEQAQSLHCPGISTTIALPDILSPMKNATNRSATPKKAAATRKHRAAGKKAAAKRKHRAAGVRAAVTKKANIAAKKRSDAARKANETRKRRVAEQQAVEVQKETTTPSPDVTPITPLT